MCMIPLCMMDLDVVETLLLKSQGWWHHYFYFTSLPTSLKEIEGKKNSRGTGFWLLFYFSGRQGAPMEKLARHPGIRGRPVYTCVSSLRTSECSSEMTNFLINRKAFHLYLEPKDLNRKSCKLNMATMAIPSIVQTLKVPRGILQFTGTYVGNHCH